LCQEAHTLLFLTPNPQCTDDRATQSSSSEQ
jgi:hypothetical protein